MESLHAIIVSRATEKKEASVVKIRSILWKKVRGVSRATEKKWRTLDNTRSILWKKVRGVSQPIEMSESHSIISVTNIRWNIQGGVAPLPFYNESALLCESHFRLSEEGE